MKKMKKKTLDYIAAGVIVLLLVGSLLINFIISYPSANASESVGVENIEQDLSRYRLEDIPEECRLPEYDYDIEWWKEHLSHHEETWHCLGYFK